MNLIKSYYSIVFMLSFALLLAFTACSDDDAAIIDPGPDPEPEPELTLVDLAQSDENFSTLVEIVVDLGLTDVLATEELTVFAPTNAAFEAISEAIPSLTNEDLEAIVTYHLVEGTILSNQLEARQDVPMLQGEVTLVEVGDSGVLINNFATVTDADLQASNGVIHAIDQVLLPDEYRVALQGPSIVETALENDFSQLLNTADDLGLTTTLKFKGPFTVFAPTDDAFSALANAVDLGAFTEEELTEVLTYHLLSGEVFSTDLQPQQAPESLTGELLYITADDDGVFVNSTSQVIAADVDEPVNGVIHVVDEVLLPNSFVDIVGLVQKNYYLTTLLSLVADRPDLAEALSDPNAELTVFAPNNEAFEAIADLIPELSEEEIVNILSYHVFPARVLSTDLDETQTIEMLNGDTAEVTVLNGTVTINGSATVVIADKNGTNGVVHVIDEVLIPGADTADAEITIDNIGASAWQFTEITGEGASADLNNDNADLVLEVGKRFTINNPASGPHPLDFRNSEGDFLLAQGSEEGSFEGDADVNFVVDGDLITFTLTEDLAAEIATYHCTVHGPMTGSVVTQ